MLVLKLDENIKMLKLLITFRQHILHVAFKIKMSKSIFRIKKKISVNHNLYNTASVQYLLTSIIFHHPFLMDSSYYYLCSLKHFLKKSNF